MDVCFDTEGKDSVQCFSHHRIKTITKLFIFFYFFLSSIFAYAKQASVVPSSKSETEPPAIGNFSLPFAQQPGPLLSLGQNMIGKGITQFYLFADDYVGTKKHYIDVTPGLLYGITDNLSVFLNAPIAASYKDQGQHSSGLEDVYLQMEYAYYATSNSRYYTQGTVVSSISAPTGSSTTQPETGYGAPTFFVGTTWSRMHVDWYYFTSYGATLPTSHNSKRFGNEYYYQGGVGRHITKTKNWMFAWLVEANGQYTAKTKNQGELDPNTGGNIVYVTPSLWASSKRLIMQVGIGLPVTQHWNGDQTRENYLAVANLGWTF